MKHFIRDKIEAAFRAAVYARADGSDAIFYFSAADFKGLCATPYSFNSSKGHTMKGYFYSYEGYDPTRLVIFEHGMGSGHRGYMKEIEMLCRGGFMVLAYDHTGCMESGGDDTGGFSQSLGDLDDLLTALSLDPVWQTRAKAVVGHSWGGFSALNIVALHPEVTHVVAMSGFLSVERMIKQLFHGVFAPVARHILEKENAVAPRLMAFDAVSSLRNTTAKVLVIHSVDDPTVSYKSSFAVLQKALGDKPNIRFLSLTGKAHNPNYTADAVQYKDAFFKTFKKSIKEKKLETAAQREAFRQSFNWQRMTAQDEAVWQEILEMLKK